MGDTETLAEQPATLREHVADEIMALLGRRRMSRRALAKALGYTNQNPIDRRLTGQTPWTVGELLRVAAVLRADPSTLLPALPSDVVQSVATLSLDDVQTMSALLGISPAEIMTRLGRTNSSYARVTGRTSSFPHVPAVTGPTGRGSRGERGPDSAEPASRRRPVLIGSTVRSPR